MHWFDRLSERSTRREVLRATAAAGVAIALPLESAAPARADGAPKCQKGCLFTAQQKWVAQYTQCANLDLYHIFTTSLFLGSFIPATFSAIESLTCGDFADEAQHGAAWNCTHSDTCAGFDPTAPGGPCDSCKLNCCTCQGTDTGYICCFYPCGGDTTCCPGG